MGVIRLLGKLLVVIFLLALLILVALWLINLDDRPPSAATLRLERRVADLPPVADADNAYVYLLGFDVADDVAPDEFGARRFHWLDARSHSPEAAGEEPRAE